MEEENYGKSGETEEDDEEVEVEVLEFSLGDEEIDELIGKLAELRETKKPLEFDIDDYNQLMINYDEDELNDESEENGKEI